mmetsp:Transcript_14125/g.17510  ORF Transcript_14125/g.17510 Transcript_14125/m.17510 type:complete len:181 (-) Transcript_14125:53-595(-)
MSSDMKLVDLTFKFFDVEDSILRAADEDTAEPTPDPDQITEVQQLSRLQRLSVAFRFAGWFQETQQENIADVLMSSVGINHQNTMDSSTQAYDKSMYRRDLCFKMMILFGAVTAVSLFVFLTINCAIGFHLLFYEQVEVKVAIDIFWNYITDSWSSWRDCTLLAFQEGDVVGMFEFIALF